MTAIVELPFMTTFKVSWLIKWMIIISTHFKDAGCDADNAKSKLYMNIEMGS